MEWKNFFALYDEKKFFLFLLIKLAYPFID